MWTLNSNARLARWRAIRQNLSKIELEPALLQTAEIWATSPFMVLYLDPSSLSKWPDPWELLVENYYCDIARCLGIVYTIYFTEHKSELTPEIRIYQDLKQRVLYSLVWFNEGKYILNWGPGEIVNKEHIEEKQLQLLYRYTSEDLKLDSY